MGRPTKYKQEMCQQAIDFMAKGFSKHETAAELGITRETLYQWEKANDEFSYAIKEGENQSNLWWAKIGMAGMTGKISGFNAATWIFNMKNRHGWKDKIETSGSVEVKFSNLSPEERVRKIKEFEDKRDQSLVD